MNDPAPVSAPLRGGPGRFTPPRVLPAVRTGGVRASVSAALWGTLDQAGERVVAGWHELAEDSPSGIEVRELVHRLIAAVREAVDDGEHPGGALPCTTLARRVLTLLRGHVLQLSAMLVPLPDSQELLRLLTALELVQHRLEPDWAQHFADRLSGPDGLELVVEVAHDIRSPLTSILFLAETLQRGQSGPVSPVQERQLGLIYSAAFGLSSMASDVIELARGGDRLVDLDPIPFSIRDILGSVQDIVHPIAEEKGIKVSVSGPERDFRQGHPVALSRVLLNLTTNALKFTDEGSVEVTARVLAGDGVEFSVRDTGRGIPPEAMLTLYEPFRRRHKPGEYSVSGTGLGLSICRKLVEAMGSTIQVQTESRKGTRFFFVLRLPVVGGLA
ncbi:MAG: sensor histidine kinase [Gemmatimonadales bacterium]